MERLHENVELVLKVKSLGHIKVVLTSMRYIGCSVVVCEGADELTSTALATGAGIDGAADDEAGAAGAAAAGPDAEVAQRYI
jgi:high-affinity K+ transport system ATPase subunit B